MITEWIIFDVFSFDFNAILSLVSDRAPLISLLKYLAAVDSSLFQFRYSDMYFSNFKTFSI